MSRQPAILILFLAGCGAVDSLDHPGDPLVTLRAELQGMTLEPPKGTHRALFGWLSVGGGGYVDCLATTNWLDCVTMPQPESLLTVFDIPLQPTSLNTLQISLWSLPQEEDLLEYQGAKLALGGLVIYDDANLNGQLDVTPPNASEPIDTLVAESAITNLRSLALYRQGPLHPYWALIAGLADCAAPPQGLSTGRIDDNFNCTVNRSNALLVTASNNERLDRALCGGPLTDLPLLSQDSFPVGPLPSNARHECLPARASLSFYIDEGNFCDQFKTRIYSLEGCDVQNDCWDLTEMPPSWWPC